MGKFEKRQVFPKITKLFQICEYTCHNDLQRTISWRPLYLTCCNIFYFQHMSLDISLTFYFGCLQQNTMVPCFLLSCNFSYRMSKMYNQTLKNRSYWISHSSNCYSKIILKGLSRIRKKVYFLPETVPLLSKGFVLIMQLSPNEVNGAELQYQKQRIVHRGDVSGKS